MNEIVKVKVESLKMQELARFELPIKEYEKKEEKYKMVIKRLTEKLS